MEQARRGGVWRQERPRRGYFARAGIRPAGWTCRWLNRGDLERCSERVRAPRSRRSVSTRVAWGCWPTRRRGCDPGRPLVVVLHGRGQGAAQFATDASWLAVTQQLQLTLVLPQQSYENNQGRSARMCDTARGRRCRSESASPRTRARSFSRRSRPGAV